MYYLDETINFELCQSGDIRLTNGPIPSTGRLEVCVNQMWGTVCSTSWDSTDSKVACVQLGHQKIGLCYI